MNGLKGYPKRGRIKRLAACMAGFAAFSCMMMLGSIPSNAVEILKSVYEDFEDETYATYDGKLVNATIDSTTYADRFYGKVLKYSYTDAAKAGFAFCNLPQDDPGRTGYDAREIGDYVIASVDFRPFGIKETGKTLYLRYGNEKSYDRWFIQFEVAPSGTLTLKTYLSSAAKLYYGGSSEKLINGGVTIAKDMDLNRMHNLKIVLYKDDVQYYTDIPEAGTPDIVGIYLDGELLDFLDNTEQTLYPLHSPVYRVPYLRAYAAAPSSEAQYGTYGVLLDHITMMKTNGAMPVAKERLKSAITEVYDAMSSLTDAQKKPVTQTLAEAETLYQSSDALQNECDAMADRLKAMVLPPLDTYLKKVSFPSVVSANQLKIPSFSGEMITTTIQSDHPDVITPEGKVMQPTDQAVTVKLTVRLSRTGESDAVKVIPITVMPRMAVELHAVTYTDADGNTVFGPTDYGRLSSVTVKKNVSSPVKILAAVSDGERLEQVKTLDGLDGEQSLAMELGENGAEKSVRFFTWSDSGTLEPLQNPIAQTSPKTVHILADSIYAELPVTSIPEGQVGIGRALKDNYRDVTINNQAYCGRSTKTFESSHMLNNVLNSIKSGDYAIISFAHNDEKSNSPGSYAPVDTIHKTAPYTEGSYQAYLVKYVDEIREQGAIPILITALPRLQFGDDGMLRETHGRYIQAMKDVAASTDCLLIDLNGYAKAEINALGKDAASRFYHTGDTTHLSAEGAAYFADYISDCIDNFRLPLSALRLEK